MHQKKVYQKVICTKSFQNGGPCVVCKYIFSRSNAHSKILKNDTRSFFIEIHEIVTNSFLT